MTTITNFVEGNFITNPEGNGTERPIWVIDSNSVPNARAITQALVWKCSHDRKYRLWQDRPLIIIDLGLRTFNRINNNLDSLTSESGLLYVKFDSIRPAYVIRTQVEERKKSGFLLDLLQRIDIDLSNSLILKKDREPAPEGWGLLVEGLEAFTVLTKNQKHCQADMQSFVSSLGSLSPLFRQIVVASNSRYLSEEVNFALERISTCLTRLTSCSQNQWQCTSTVRRYTGYFKQQQYTITIKDNRVKVAKVKFQKPQEKNQMQAELFGGLGFKAEKDEETHKMQKELREMIFPHLRVQKQCDKTPCETNCECKETPVPEDLIILDEEQEDDQDLDV